MSISHHQSPEEIEAQRRMLQEFLGNAKPRFPHGKIDQTDEGELSFAVAADPRNNTIVIRFSKPVDWIGLQRKEVTALIELLNEKLTQIQ